MNNNTGKSSSAKTPAGKTNTKAYKKGYVMLAGLILIVGVAVYLNWQFNIEKKDFAATNVLAQDEVEAEDSVKNYGDAQFVSTSSDSSVDEAAAMTAKNSGDEYFAQARLTRQNTRDEAVALIKDTLEGVKVTEDVKTQAALKIAEIAQRIEQEGKIENLIKAKGFEDCMVYLDGENADVVVKSDGLLDSQVIQIKDIVQSQADITGDIKIVEIK